MVKPRILFVVTVAIIHFGQIGAPLTKPRPTEARPTAVPANEKPNHNEDPPPYEEIEKNPKSGNIGWIAKFKNAFLPKKQTLLSSGKVDEKASVYVATDLPHYGDMTSKPFDVAIVDQFDNAISKLPADEKLKLSSDDKLELSKLSKLVDNDPDFKEAPVFLKEMKSACSEAFPFLRLPKRDKLNACFKTLPKGSYEWLWATAENLKQRMTKKSGWVSNWLKTHSTADKVLLGLLFFLITGTCVFTAVGIALLLAL